MRPADDGLVQGGAMMYRVSALLSKELSDLGRNRAVFFPAVLTGAMAMIIPFFVALIVPYFAGERLSDSSDFQVALQMYRTVPAAAALRRTENSRRAQPRRSRGPRSCSASDGPEPPRAPD